MVTNTRYKQTDIGPIPDHWDVIPIKNMAFISTGSKNTQDRIEDGDYPFFVRSQFVERINSYSFDGEAVLTAGDGVGTGKVFHYINGKFDYHQRVYNICHFANNINGYFFYLFFSSNFLNRITQMTAKSSVDSVRMDMIANMLIPVPPISEQNDIANAITEMEDYITSLNKLIAKKLLIRQGSLQHLLTPKDNWGLQKLSDVCWFQEGPGLRNWQFTKQGMKVINITNIENGRLNLERTDRHISIEEFNKMYKHFEIDENDIVVASSGNSYAKIAVVKKRDLPLMMNTSVIRFKPSKNLNYNYLLIFLKSKLFKDQIDLIITGGAQPNFGPAHLKKVLIHVPTLVKQKAISEILVDMDSEIEMLDINLEKAKKLKQAMLQQLLTGKMRLL